MGEPGGPHQVGHTGPFEAALSEEPRRGVQDQLPVAGCLFSAHFHRDLLEGSAGLDIIHDDRHIMLKITVIIYKLNLHSATSNTRSFRIWTGSILPLPQPEARCRCPLLTSALRKPNPLRAATCMSRSK